ncbi:MAG: PEP-CTERM system histidine kinase PrsK [Deltaproteobacteria bacterium]|jgi:putative PEP-CTERM system histidine kinase|nr:PEP-CTERM system histidine kinase PrsK [Deltaproteobacteria bacterium]
MNFLSYEYLYLTAALLSTCLGIMAAVHNSRSLSRWCFFAGMLVLAGEQVCSFLSATSNDLLEIQEIQFRRMMLTSILPAPWLAFSLIYGKEKPRDALAGWKLLLAASLLFPIIFTLLGHNWLSPIPMPLDFSLSEWNLPVGRTGYALFVYLLLASVLITANLERILRASTGAIRWRIKFYLLGIMLVFAVRIYSAAQVLLFSSFPSGLLYVEALSLIAADGLIILGFIRGARQEIRFYVSEEFMSSSITMLAVGIYLLGLGIVYKLSTLFDLLTIPFLSTSLIIIACVGTITLLSSTQFRYGVRTFIQRHFQRPRYDYQSIWCNFVHRTSFVRTEKELANIAVRLLSEVFGVSSASIWLWDEKTRRSRLIGSTSLFNPDSGSSSLSTAEREISYLMLSVRHETRPLNLARDSWKKTSQSEEGAVIEDNPAARIACCAPLLAGTTCLGVITLNSRFNRVPFDEQDFNLLDIISRQIAGILYTKVIGRELEQARQMQAFQAFSAFFVHDLKNVASSLSLTLQNLPIHYDNPEFRKDALELLAQGVEKINSMCGRLSFFRNGLELHKSPTDLDQVIGKTLATLDGSLRACVTQELTPIPNIEIDEEAIQKVLLNLLLNAWQAVSNGDRPDISIRTSIEGKFAVISVTDNGCGMSEEFIENSLFQPFQTTKKKGLGIGLYQCRQIIEAHGGRIAVESRQGAGTTFRAYLPVSEDTFN